MIQSGTIRSGTIRVLVAADSPVVRLGLSALLTGRTELALAGDAPVAAALGADSTRTDAVLLVLDGNEEAGIAELEAGPHDGGTPAIVLMIAEPAVWAAEALRAGVRGVLPLDAGVEEIEAALAAAAVGLITLHPEATAALMPSTAPARPLTAATQSLTPRELEVLAMLAEGLGNKTIARRLGISEHTVKFHIGSIFTKLGAQSRTEAVTLGARQGLIML